METSFLVVESPGGMFASLLSSSAPKEEDGRGSSGRAERSRQEPSFSQSQALSALQIADHCSCFGTWMYMGVS